MINLNLTIKPNLYLNLLFTFSMTHVRQWELYLLSMLVSVSKALRGQSRTDDLQVSLKEET